MLQTLEVEESAIFTGALGETVDVEAEFVRYIYENPPFVIANFMDDSYEDFSVLGNIPFELKAGRRYRISGEIEESYSKFLETTVRQLRLKGIALLPPSGEAGIIRYLQTLKGLKSRSFALYETYKEDTLRIMREDPERVAKEVKGVSLKQALKFQEQLLDQEESSETLTFLLNIGLSLNECESLIRSHGDDVKEKIEKNPYLLTKSGYGWPGMSFPRVDRLAMEWGVDPRIKERLEAGIMFIFKREGDFGHCYSDFDRVVTTARQLLSSKYLAFEYEEIEVVVERMLLNDTLLLDGDRLYIKKFFEMENELAKRILELSRPNVWSSPIHAEDIVDEYLANHKIHLEQKQREAVLTSIRNKGDFVVVNGAAGTGKTFTADIILRLMIQIYEQDNPKKKAMVSVLAPTGKASKVLKKALKGQYPTMTIHRALRPEDGKFFHDRNNPLDANIFVVDETSMLDTSLAHALMEAIPDGSKIILLGDIRQLPAIGPGNVLGDIMKSGLVPLVKLNVPKRQAKGSSIYENAKRILDHDTIIPDNQDTLWSKTGNGYQATQRTLQIIKQISTYEKDDIQVLAPMKAGKAGTHILNYQLQRLWNADKEDSKILNHTFEVDGQTHRLYFREGDKVMQVVNNTALEWVIEGRGGIFEKDEKNAGTVVTNGEQGTILKIYEDEVRTMNGRLQKSMVIAVQYDEGIVLYRGNEKKDLDHAYAISIHKSQGSQWPVIIQIMDYNSHGNMLSNELFYTGYSRASERHVLIADEASVNIATNQRVATKRRTSLLDRLHEGGV